MALLKIFSVRDSKVSVFGKPFCDSSEIQATRALNIAVNDPTIQLSHFPEDFDLYDLGTFDETSGHILPREAPLFIVSAISVKKLGNEIDRIEKSLNPEKELIRNEKKNDKNKQSIRTPGE